MNAIMEINDKGRTTMEKNNRNEYLGADKSWVCVFFFLKNGCGYAGSFPSV